MACVMGVSSCARKIPDRDPGTFSITAERKPRPLGRIAIDSRRALQANRVTKTDVELPVFPEIMLLKEWRTTYVERGAEQVHSFPSVTVA